jgi:cation diffusion facilitator CzcD-associated flavoprotein CzcO
MSEAPNPAALAALETQVRREIDLLADPGQSWVRPRQHPSGRHVFDVLIIGAGQSGLGAAFALKREGVTNTICVDENPEGLEGPWMTYARMITLRTPKHLTGVETGLPSLTYRAFHEAQWGEASWQALDKIPRSGWMDYLRWFRRATGLDVRNGAKVTGVARESEDVFAVSIADDPTPALARKVVLATGIQGGGEWHVPPFIRDNLPSELYAHTSAPIDFTKLKGKRIGILGAGASAFDNAQHALNEGADRVQVFVRRKRLPRVNPIRHMERTGLAKRYAFLDDARKYAALSHYLRLAMPPTNDTFQRAKSHPGFRLHLGTPWEAVSYDNGQAVVTTPYGDHRFDFLIVSTGILNDLSLRPELAGFITDIALWRDRFTSSEASMPEIDSHPYLGRGFELTGKDEQAARRLKGLFLFNYSALASMGLSASALSGLRYALPRLVEGVAGQLFIDDQDEILGSFYAYDEAEFVSAEGD